MLAVFPGGLFRGFFRFGVPGLQIFQLLPQCRGLLLQLRRLLRGGCAFRPALLQRVLQLR